MTKTEAFVVVAVVVVAVWAYRSAERMKVAAQIQINDRNASVATENGILGAVSTIGSAVVMALV